MDPLGNIFLFSNNDSLKWTPSFQQDKNITYSIYYKLQNNSNWGVVVENIKSLSTNWNIMNLKSGEYDIKIIAKNSYGMNLSLSIDFRILVLNIEVKFDFIYKTFFDLIPDFAISYLNLYINIDYHPDESFNQILDFTLYCHSIDNGKSFFLSPVNSNEKEYEYNDFNLEKNLGYQNNFTSGNYELVVILLGTNEIFISKSFYYLNTPNFVPYSIYVCTIFVVFVLIMKNSLKMMKSIILKIHNQKSNSNSEHFQNML